MDSFIHLSLPVLIIAAIAASAPARAAGKGKDDQGICVTIGNHWSYIGIGWQLGIESCVLSAEDAMEMYDRAGVKTCLNMDARAFEFMQEKFPEVVARLKKYLAEGKVELIGGTYGQPMGTTVSGESNIRQIVVGRETIKKALGYDLTTFLEEEEFAHPQLPQILRDAGFKYGSLTQLDTWGKAGAPRIDLNVLNWQGIDGSTIPANPKNALFLYGGPLADVAKTEDVQKLHGLGKPLLINWEEFGWDSPEQPAYLTTPDAYKQRAGSYPVEYVTLTQYMDKYGAHPKETIKLKMDDWDKSLTWGLGGDQVRIYDRKVEATLLAAETFDAIASTLGGRARTSDMDAAWKDLLASQSHDVGLCEYSRWQGGRMAPFDRVEDLHNFAWGTMGYIHLDAAQKQGQAVLDGALGRIAGKVRAVGEKGDLTLTVFNPCNGPRSEVIETGRIYPIPAGVKAITITDSKGQTVASQIVKSESDKKGNLVMANVAFLASRVPSVGYDTYFIKFKKAALPKSDLVIDEANLTMENTFVRVKLDPKTGAVASVVDKRTGREALSSPFPVFKGKPDEGYPLHWNQPDHYDTSTSQAQIDWLEKGAVRATVRAHHELPYLGFETRVSLSAKSPYVEVATRLLLSNPPHRDWEPKEIKMGYWISLGTPGQPTSVVRDYPLAIEPTTKKEFSGLTFVDMVNDDGGLLYLHPGTQWFRFGENGDLENLLVREWESFYSAEWGWPRYCEYRHALMPHGKGMTNAERERASTEFSRPLICVQGKPHTGDLPLSNSFLSVSPASVQLSCFRRLAGGSYELRVVECEGKSAKARASLHVPVQRGDETNLLGRRLSALPVSSGAVKFDVGAWKVVTARLR